MISKEKKTAIMNEYARTPGDTGSPEVQVAVLTARIQELTDASEGEPQGSSFSSWYAEDGRSETWSSGVPEEEGY